MKSKEFEKLLKTVHKLRAPGGCPWDRKQTHLSLKPYLIEESYEVLDAIDQSISNRHDGIRFDSLIEELGDVLLQVLLHAEIAKEEKHFDLETISHKLNDKLIRRHPHVFKSKKKSQQKTTAEGAYKNWEIIKASEKKNPTQSTLDSLPRAMPALQRTTRMIERMERLGFQFKNLQGTLDKIKEEILELEEARDSNKTMELGDVLFSLCNYAQYLKIDPEEALKQSAKKCENRFRYVELRVKNLPERSKATLEQMDAYWEEAKILEEPHLVYGLTGGIGAGKSEVEAILKTSGFAVIDADALTRALSAPGGAAHQEILETFGTADKNKLRKIIENDPRQRKSLEAILHPKIREAFERDKIQALLRYQKTKRKKPWILFYSAALLVETKHYQAFDGLIVVEANLSNRLKRLQTRPEFDLARAKRWIKMQASDQERRKVATIIFKNNGDINALHKKVHSWISTLTAR